jgi:hypothetical protein
MTSEHNSRPGHLLRLAAALTALALGACAASRPDQPREYLDEVSAATVTVAPGGLVFARERPELAVHARDYITLVPLDVNHSGQHSQYFYVYVWSTIDKRGLPARDASSGQIELLADGRQIPLVPAKATPRELGLAVPPVRPPSDSAELLIAPTDRETLEFLSRATDIRAIAWHDGVSDRYDLWSGNSGGILALL